MSHEEHTLDLWHVYKTNISCSSSAMGGVKERPVLTHCSHITIALALHHKPLSTPTYAQLG